MFSLSALALASCGGGQSKRTFEYQAIPDVPQPVNDLGKQIGQQQRDVVTPGGDQFHPGFSAADRNAFESSGRLGDIVTTVTHGAEFTNGVAALAALPTTTQTRVYTAFSTPIDKTWSENGKIGVGVTDAGKAVELAIATALTDAVREAVRTHGSPGEPRVTLTPPSAGASILYGNAYNCDPARTKVVIYALTNVFYVQPTVADPFTNIGSNGAWSNVTNGWDSLVVLLVDPIRFTPAASLFTQPSLQSGVLAFTTYPDNGPVSLQFSGRTFGIKVTGSASPSYRFDPGPNYFTNDPRAVHVDADGLHLKTLLINGTWRCTEVHLTESLGFGTYTVRMKSALDHLDRNTVASPLFLYDKPGAELDFEFSGVGGLVESPFTGQCVVQPYSVPGNIVRYSQPAASQFSLRIEWRADHVTFISWTDWEANPSAASIIQQWTYTGANIPTPGSERVHFSNWLLGGAQPLDGVGDEVIIHDFTFAQ